MNYLVTRNNIGRIIQRGSTEIDGTPLIIRKKKLKSEASYLTYPGMIVDLNLHKGHGTQVVVEGKYYFKFFDIRYY